jgi:F-type H+-transporting ATPase subunit b
MEHHHSFFAEPRNWVAVAFVLFVVLFGRRLWAAYTAMVDGRAAVIRAELEEAGRLRAEAERMLETARSERDAALAEARAVLERSHAEAARLAEEAREEASRAARHREQMAMDRIAAAEKAAVAEVRQTAATVAVQAAERVIATGLPPEADRSLIDKAIAALPRALRAA